MLARRERIPGMTVEEFIAWYPDDRRMRWQLIDGVPTAMAPPGTDHARIHGALALQIGLHLERTRPDCVVLIGPGVIPFVESDSNFRIPDLAVTCEPPDGGRDVKAPRLIVEVLSPSNAHITRQNVWAYTTVPSLLEIVLLEGTRIGAAVYARAASGSWPRTPRELADGDTLELASIGLSVPLRDLYRATTVAARR